jgi:hypothetical protein
MPDQNYDARAKRYRKHAEEFRSAASGLRTEAGRKVWLDLAHKWEQMAERAEQQSEQRRIAQAAQKSKE